MKRVLEERIERGLVTPGLDPLFQRGLREVQQTACGRLRVCRRVQLFDGLANVAYGLQAMPFSRNSAFESERFSWRPTLRADSPSAMPMS